jgi:hypothetical protein
MSQRLAGVLDLLQLSLTAPCRLASLPLPIRVERTFPSLTSLLLPDLSSDLPFRRADDSIRQVSLLWCGGVRYSILPSPHVSESHRSVKHCAPPALSGTAGG